MNEVTLEKIDIIRERTGATYAEAKTALEATNGNVVDALINLEQNKKTCTEEGYTTTNEFVAWLKNTLNKGNVTRIKIKKEDKVIVDIPVNAGIVAGLFAIIWPPLLAIGVLTAVFVKLTIEITKEDGTVEVVNKIIKNTVQEVKEKVTDLTSEMKDKFSNKKETQKTDENVYQYTVKFEDIKDKSNEGAAPTDAQCPSAPQPGTEPGPTVDPNTYQQ